MFVVLIVVLAATLAGGPRIVEGPALSVVEGLVLSTVEGPALSVVEGLVLSTVEGLVLSTVEGQQPETLSLLGEPLYAPKLPKTARAAADAELARAHAAYTAAPSGVPEVLALARAHLALGRVGDALIILTNGLEANPDAAELLAERGAGYILIRKFDVAARDLTKAAAKLPAARCHLGFAQYLAGDYHRARTSYAECADAGVFGYLADRRAGGTPGARPVPAGPAASTPPPIRLPGTVSRPAAAAQPFAAIYLDAIELLLAGDDAGARDRLKKVVERNRKDWMDPAYIAAEADYARLRVGRDGRREAGGGRREAGGGRREAGGGRP